MERVALLGYGRFGRAFGQLLSEAEIPYRALDPQVEIPLEHRATNLPELLSNAQIVVFAVPMAQLHAALEQARPHLTASQLVLDVVSVKVKPVETLAAVLGKEIPWVGTHPLFGPVSLSRAERPMRVVICPNPLHPEMTAKVRAFFERLECEVIEQTPDQHDQVMAQTHALTFFLARGMIEAGAGQNVPFAPPSFQGMARTIETVRSDAFHLFAAIQGENPYARDARQHLVDTLTRIHRELELPPTPESPLVSGEKLERRPSPELTEVRDRIDEVDRELVEMLERRIRLAQRAAQAKAALGYPVLDEGRETALLAKRRAWAEELGLDASGIEEIFRALLRFSRKAQQ